MRMGVSLECYPQDQDYSLQQTAVKSEYSGLYSVFRWGRDFTMKAITLFYNEKEE